MEVIGDIWNGLIIRPMINSLVLLYYVFFSSFGLSIIVFTVLIRVAMTPLTVKQSRQMKAMTALQPRIKAIQERYAKDKQKASQEVMRLYREMGVNPLGCLGPMIIQMPIFFGLFWALRGTLPSTPERLSDLSGHLYSWLPVVNEAVPLNSDFLWLDLGKFASQNPLPILLPLLVGSSMWVMQKMTTTPSATPQQESTQRMMLWMMPIMFGYFTLFFETGLALYWIVSNLIGIAIQGFVTGWGPVLNLVSLRPTKREDPAPVAAPRAEEPTKDEDNRDDSQNSGGGNRDRPKGTRRRARGRRNRRR